MTTYNILPVWFSQAWNHLEMHALQATLQLCGQGLWKFTTICRCMPCWTLFLFSLMIMLMDKTELAHVAMHEFIPLFSPRALDRSSIWGFSMGVGCFFVSLGRICLPPLLWVLRWPHKHKSAPVSNYFYREPRLMDLPYHIRCPYSRSGMGVVHP